MPPVGAAHVFVSDLAGPVLSSEDLHHLQRVLRLRPGEEVTASDGRGGWRRCEFVVPGGLSAVAPISYSERLLPEITVAFALTKGERPEWTVQKLAEAGVDRIMPMLTARTVVRWEGEKVTRQVERLRAVARAAAMQSRRVWLPVVSELVEFGSLVGSGPGRASGSQTGPGVAAGSACMAQPGGDPPDLSRPVVLIGPEGGWDDEELGRGLPPIGLGPTVLRSETAAMAAGVLLCALRAGVVCAR